ncbi:hypothetical protein [Chromobacterium haemolyticum]|uniref:hypothetical protein n=1 Tax=Chromobacterium haemolyticum TaxID=394935 RepID=UPI001745EE0D|nr:hypothetical protein [Chromobacterium haemolyticum]QOD84902.1 hypothetical protein IEZ30_10655 [Chromobacterium haemolyticum]
MKASQPQKLTYRLHDVICPSWAVHRSSRAKAVHGFHSAFCRDYSRSLLVSPDIDARDRPLSLQCLPSYAHLLAPKPRHMLWSVRYIGQRNRQQPYRPVELVTFAPVHGFFHGINRHGNGNYLLMIIRHRNEFNPAASRCID